MIKELWKKMFYSSYYFTIAVRKRPEHNILQCPNFSPEYILKATPKKWAADPFLVDYEDSTYLFFESVINNKGRIEVAEIDSNGTILEPRVVLEDECHYSYPFVFQLDQEWYMIPESSACGEVRLYKAYAFPYDWRLEQVLLYQRAVDTTLFFADKQMYLQSFLITQGTERVTPQVFRVHWTDVSMDLEQVLWKEYNELECRGAGAVFSINNRNYRPAQKNKDLSYGDGVIFYRVQDISQEYREEFVGELTPSMVCTRGVLMDGLHTYSVSERFEAIDIRCRMFDFWKTPRVLYSKAKKLIKCKGKA